MAGSKSIVCIGTMRVIISPVASSAIIITIYNVVFQVVQMTFSPCSLAVKVIYDLTLVDAHCL